MHTKEQTNSEKVICCRNGFRPVMDRFGFGWQDGDEFDREGMSYSWGRFINGDRMVRFAFGPLYALLRYHVGVYDVSHRELLFAVGNIVSAVHDPAIDYPGDVVVAAGELEEHGRAFLDGSIAGVKRILGKLEGR